VATGKISFEEMAKKAVIWPPSRESLGFLDSYPLSVDTYRSIMEEIDGGGASDPSRSKRT